MANPIFRHKLFCQLRETPGLTCGEIQQLTGRDNLLSTLWKMVKSGELRRVRKEYHLTAKGHDKISQLEACIKNEEFISSHALSLKGKKGRYCGFCKRCGTPFRSHYQNRYFCSMFCYTKSEECQKRLRENSLSLSRKARIRAGIPSNERLKKNCLFCQKEFFVKPKEFKNKKYCSTPCYRKWMAERFDRWIAAPQSIALPQGYDEFLTQDELPCLIEGCDWRGKELGNHINFTHGIVANDFKKIAGFNKGTGLIAPDLAQYLSERRRQLAPWEDSSSWGIARFVDGHSQQAYPLSLEAREHMAKARAILGSVGATKNGLCPMCNQKFVSLYMGRKIYCSLHCRNIAYRERAKNKRTFSLVCQQCCMLFIGDIRQNLRYQKGLPVFCSPHCRGVRAGILLSQNRR